MNPSTTVMKTSLSFLSLCLLLSACREDPQPPPLSPYIQNRSKTVLGVLEQGNRQVSSELEETRAKRIQLEALVAAAKEQAKRSTEAKLQCQHIASQKGVTLAPIQNNPSKKKGQGKKK